MNEENNIEDFFNVDQDFDLEKELHILHRTSSNNKELIKDSFICGCFHCGRLIKPVRVKNWIDNGKTALCPYCEIDSVVPLDGYPWQILKNMKDTYFEGID